MNNKDFNDDYFINMLIDISKDDTQNSCPNVCQNEITYKDNIALADTSEKSSEAAFLSAQPIRPMPRRSVRPIPSPPRPPVRPVPPPSPPRPPVRPVPPRQPLPRPPRPIMPIPI
ncbi:MAG: hypothetical protein PHE12_01590, partial [Clostridia bacterium]|nr:hypothetical protein [Clostridia bacterium]